MCKYLRCNCSKICVNYGGIVDIVVGVILICLKDYIIPSFYSEIHNYVVIGVSCFLVLKGTFLVLVLKVGKKVRPSVLVYLITTTVFLLLAKIYVVYCAIKKYQEVEYHYSSEALKLHHHYIIIITFALICPTIIVLMWHIQLYLYLFYHVEILKISQCSRQKSDVMVENCCHTKVGAFIAAAINLVVGGLTLGGFIYKVAVVKNGRIGLIVIMFLMSILLIYNGMLLIVGIVMVNKVYVLLYVVLNCMNWLVGTFVIIKEISYNILFAGFLIVVLIMTCFEFVVYKFYKQMCKFERRCKDTEAARSGFCNKSLAKQ